MQDAKQGFFITLEGSEGAGKSTQMQTIKAFFESKGYEVITTREPGGTKIAEQIRSILLTKDAQEPLCSTSELLLMYAARAQLVNSLIKPNLMSGKVVISDRFDLSTIAYQCAGRGIDLKTIADLRNIAIGDFAPNLTLLFDIDVKLGIERAAKRSAKDRFEEESLAFFSRVRQGFLDYAHEHPNQVTIIDAAQDLETVTNEVTRVLEQKFQDLV